MSQLRNTKGKVSSASRPNNLRGYILLWRFNSLLFFTSLSYQSYFSRDLLQSSIASLHLLQIVSCRSFVLWLWLNSTNNFRLLQLWHGLSMGIVSIFIFSVFGICIIWLDKYFFACSSALLDIVLYMKRLYYLWSWGRFYKNDISSSSYYYDI